MNNDKGVISVVAEAKIELPKKESVARLSGGLTVDRESQAYKRLKEAADKTRLDTAISTANLNKQEFLALMSKKKAVSA